MEQEQVKLNPARGPDYRGHLEVSVWESKTKDGKPYLSVVIGRELRVACFKPEIKKGTKPLGATW